MRRLGATLALAGAMLSPGVARAAVPDNAPGRRARRHALHGLGVGGTPWTERGRIGRDRSLEELRADFADLSRFDGVFVRLRRARARSRRGRLVKRYTDPSRRIAGKASVRVRVVR